MIFFNMQSAKLPISLFPLAVNNCGEKFGAEKRDFRSVKPSSIKFPAVTIPVRENIKRISVLDGLTFE
jgi:hypothetical protein